MSLRRSVSERCMRCLCVCGWAASAVAAGFASADEGAAKTAEVYTAWPFAAPEAAKRQEETAKALGMAKEVTVGLGGSDAIPFVLIPAGRFRMGDAPGREVTIGKPFYMGKFKVTQAQYARIMGKNPSKHPGKSNPVDSVDWALATEFAKKVAEKSNRKVRLPSEAEWEWSCRAGTSTRCYWGDDMTRIGEYCWWHDNCGMTTHPVGQKKPNAFGLYDTMGLAWEWCSDGGPDAKDHPCRGATFGSKVGMFKSSVRLTVGVGANDRFGFRVAMDVD